MTTTKKEFVFADILNRLNNFNEDVRSALKYLNVKPESTNYATYERKLIVDDKMFKLTDDHDFDAVQFDMTLGLSRFKLSDPDHLTGLEAFAEQLLKVDKESEDYKASSELRNIVTEAAVVLTRKEDGHASNRTSSGNDFSARMNRAYLEAQIGIKGALTYNDYDDDPVNAVTFTGEDLSNFDVAKGTYVFDKEVMGKNFQLVLNKKKYAQSKFSYF